MLSTPPAAADVDLTDPAFWAAPRSERLSAFALLRRELPISFQKPPIALAPAAYPPQPYWAVTRYDDVKRLFKANEVSCERGATPGLDAVPREILLCLEGPLATDEPLHSRLRRCVAKQFTPRVIQTREQLIARRAKLAVTNVAERGECNFVHDLAIEFSFNVISDLLGVPDSDRKWLAEYLGWLLPSDGSAPPMDLDQLVAGTSPLMEYAIDLVRQRRAAPADDLTSVIAATPADRELSDEELGALFTSVLLAGIDTTAASAGHGMLALTEHPDERRRWQQDFDALAPTAVEEVLRWASTVPSERRIVSSQIEVSGTTLEPGTTIILFILSANFDETVFAEPQRFDVSRDPNPHQTFSGGGIHICLGAALARLELTCLFRELFSALPDIEVSGKPIYTAWNAVHGFRELPCSFTPKKL